MAQQHSFPARACRSSAGFTLIETLFAASILVSVLLAALAFRSNLFSMDRMLQYSLNNQHEVRQALRVLSAELRSVSASSLGAYPLANAADTSLVVYRDLNGDGLKERIRYFLDGTTLKKGVVDPAGNPLTYDGIPEQVSELAHNLDAAAGPIFQYFDSTYDGTTAPLPPPIEVTRVRLIKVTLVVSPEPLRGSGGMTLTTQVSLRNLKGNL